MRRIDAATRWSIGLWFVFGFVPFYFVPEFSRLVGWHKLLNHQGAAAWVQAIGSILAIVGSVAIVRHQQRLARLAQYVAGFEADREFAFVAFTQTAAMLRSFEFFKEKLESGEIGRDNFAIYFEANPLEFELEVLLKLTATPPRLSPAHRVVTTFAGTSTVLLKRLMAMGAAGGPDAWVHQKERFLFGVTGLQGQLDDMRKALDHACQVVEVVTEAHGM